jgi:LDH2 family malate/lactate/ureidoglycolate dehydrogenase
MATSIVAKSKINEYFKSGEPIPLGWATDLNGIPTRSALEAINGLIIPIAEYKGSGLSMAFDLLAGLLSGSGYLTHVNKFYSSTNTGMNVGNLFIFLNPKLIYGKDFYTKVDNYVSLIRNSKSKTNSAVRIPGDNKRMLKNNFLKNGIPLSHSLVDDLNELKTLFNLDLNIEERNS